MRVSSRAIASVVLAAALGTLGAACSLILDFDRSKVQSSGTGGKSGTGGHAAGGVTTDSGQGGTPETGGGGTGGAAGDAGGDAPRPACDPKTHAGCDKDELCCDTTAGPACKKTSLDECESCGVACPKGLAAACAARTCECEPSTNRPCSGTGAESMCLSPASGSPTCVECVDSTDCPTGKSECVANKCVQCNAQDYAGCGGDKPICDETTNTCKACTMTPNDCLGTLKCTASGACGGCANSATDCATPTTPICDSGKTTCRACKDNAECVSERGKPYCVEQGRCADCDPTTEEGCSDPAKPDCRFESNELKCLPCTADDQCKGHTATPVCNTATGRCVGCTSDNDCTGNAKKPLCADNACVACDDAAVTGDADTRCHDKPEGKVACVRAGTQKGECGACDPTDSIPCASDELCCETNGIAACVAATESQCTGCGVPCNPTLANTCSNRGCRCGSGAACSGTGSEKVCVGSPGTCAECAGNADCTNAATPLCVGNHCVACNGSSGCDVASTKPICASTSCRGCNSDAECSALSGGPGPLCGGNGACGPDDACSMDGDCTDGVHGQCVDVGSGALRCRVCDPSDNTGCTQPEPTCSSTDFVCGP